MRAKRNEEQQQTFFLDEILDSPKPTYSLKITVHSSQAKEKGFIVARILPFTAL